MVDLIINPATSRLKKIRCDTTPATRVSSIIEAYAENNGGLDPNRIKLSYVDDEAKDKTKAKRTLKSHLTLAENGLDFSQNPTLHVTAKDVGRQIGWKTVFIIEYLGPMFIHSLFYYLWYDAGNVTNTQLLAFNLTLLHYLKREYETLFVHSFSADTMPFAFLFRNSAHYWIINGVFIGFAIYAPQDVHYTGIWKWVFHVADRTDDELKLFGALMVLFELCNFHCHRLLKQLRSDGSREHKIPRGFAFELVSFPNYMFESLSWLVFAVMVNNWSAYLFLVVGTGTMMVWAKQKHAKYRKEFGDDYPKHRRAMFPYVF